jgi:hypothetical protein
MVEAAIILRELGLIARVSDRRLPIANLVKIGNWKSTIGNDHDTRTLATG